jgi:co-chaperonin GroES (HSP10)
MRAPKHKILFTPDKVVDKVNLGGVEIIIPNGHLHSQEQMHNDWPITGTVAVDTKIDITDGGYHYKLELEAGDRILFNYNVVSTTRDNNRERFHSDDLPEGFKDVQWCYPSDIFVYWKKDVPHATGEFIITARHFKKEETTASGIILLGADSLLPNGAKAIEGVLDGEGTLQIKGDTSHLGEDSGWDKVEVGHRLVFPASSQIEVKIDGNAAVNGEKVYRQRYSDIFGHFIGEDFHPLGPIVLIEADVEDKRDANGIIIPDLWVDRKNPYKFGRVVMAGPQSMVVVGEKVAYNDICRWRITLGGKTYVVVHGNEEGIAYVIE